MSHKKKETKIKSKINQIKSKEIEKNYESKKNRKKKITMI